MLCVLNASCKFWSMPSSIYCYVLIGDCSATGFVSAIALAESSDSPSFSTKNGT